MNLRLLAMVGGLVVMTGMATPVAAQQSTMSMGLFSGSNSFRPDLTQRDLKVIIRVLGLQGESLKALQDLYDGYAGTLASEGVAVREYVAEVIEKAETLQNAELVVPARTKISEWEVRSEQIKKTFLEDLKSLLSRDEEARWPIVERELRRLKYVGSGILTGENVDMVKLTEDVVGESGAQGEVAELLNRYSEELDHVLVARKRALDENKEEYSSAIKTDPDKARKCWGAVNDARLAVQALNDRYASLIAGVMPGDKKQKFERAWLERCYPMACRPSRVDEYLKDAKELQSLSAEQKTQLKAIGAAYEATSKSRYSASPARRPKRTASVRLPACTSVTRSRTLLTTRIAVASAPTGTDAIHASRGTASSCT